MTDVTARCFVSYRRTPRRVDEAAVVIEALHDVGVPTWQDVTNLEAEPAVEELRRVLRDRDEVASAVMWLSPEVADSHVIRKVEAPEIIQRHEAKDGFYAQPVAAGGLDYAKAGDVASRHLGIRDLSAWNLEKADGDPIDRAEAARIAELVMRRRIKEVVARLDGYEALRLCLQTRERPPVRPDTALTLDWSHRFDGRMAPPEAWDERLLPAVAVVAASIRELAPDRVIEVRGLCSLPAGVALGAAFLAPTGADLRWHQSRAGQPDQVWSLAAAREEAPIVIDTVEQDTSSADMAVLVSLSQDVEEALRASAADEVPRFRGFVRVRGTEGVATHIATPGQAANAAYLTVQAIHAARGKWRDIRRVHLFIAGPTGFSVLLGQLLNGLGRVQTYEHIPDDALGSYRRAALLRTGA
jgi:SMODS-associated and fused to various effectors sensor domain